MIVKSMLLTGFDAPIEGVMYLDRPIREAELLQAIARVNRTGHGKKAGSSSTTTASPGTSRRRWPPTRPRTSRGRCSSLEDELPSSTTGTHRVVATVHGSRHQLT